MKKIRGFEFVREEMRKHDDAFYAEMQEKGYNHKIVRQLPIKTDPDSAGYDFVTPATVTIPAKSQVLIWSDIKAYMQRGEVLQIYPRSSIGLKGIQIRNTVGIIDKSYYSTPKNDKAYYSNSKNDGNIGICLYNDTDEDITFNAGERIAQGIFMPYLTADNEQTLGKTRNGGFGSSGK